MITTRKSASFRILFILSITCFTILLVSSCTKTKGNLGGHDYVDLGLPSGTLWATANVGAASEKEKGSHLKWFEIKNIDWGEQWKAPTTDQIQELLISSQMKCQRGSQNEVLGFTFKSKYNGASIFLPTAGSSSKDTSGKVGYYWSSSCSSPMAADILFFKQLEDSIASGVASFERSFTLSVRLVTKKSK